MRRQIIIQTVFLLGTAMIAMGAPPVPFFDDNEPGLFMPFTGELDDPDTWDYEPGEWGGSTYNQPSKKVWQIVESPFSDGGAACRGNKPHPDPDQAELPCVNVTRRYHPTFKNPEDSKVRIPMNPSKDWVFTASFVIEPTDTFGVDRLIELGVPGSDMIMVYGANDTNDNSSTLEDGTENRYRIVHGPWPDGQPRPYGTLIDRPITQGTVTVRYDASDQLLDFWLDDELILENIESLRGTYDLHAVQLSGGGVTFEDMLWDEVYIGVLAEGAACGPEGPGTGIPGDLNCDGAVDVADLGIVGANFNANNATYVDGDANLDDSVDVADLGMVGANWSAAQGVSLSQALQQSSLSTLIPEPATIAVLALSLVCTGCRRRRAKAGPSQS